MENTNASTTTNSSAAAGGTTNTNVASATTNSSAAAGGTSNTNASTTTNTSAAAGGTSSSDIEPNKFPTHLISLDSTNDDGEQIFKSVLLLAKNAGGWTNAFGHKKKRPFLENAAQSLFNMNSQFNQ